MKKTIASFSALLLVLGLFGGMNASAENTTLVPVGSASALGTSDAHPTKVSISRGGEAIIEGDVVAVSGSELVVRSWGGDWQVSGGQLTGNTLIIGDSVRVEGKASGLNIVSAQLLKNRTKHSDINRVYTGAAAFPDATVTRVDPANHAFWVDQGGQPTLIRANERTRFDFGGQNGNFGDLKPGMKVNLGGLRASDNSNVLAMTISARDINVINNRGNNSSARVDQSATDASLNDSNNRVDASDRSITDASDRSVVDDSDDIRTDNSIDDSGNSAEETDLSPLGD